MVAGVCLLFSDSAWAADEPLQLAALSNDLAATYVTAPKPLLYGISESDLKEAKRVAEQHYAKRWDLVSKRSRFVRHRLVESLKQQTAPLSLQVIPVVESTYNPYALSHSGALGLWQLMPETARGLGIKPDKKIDGRRAIESSTNVASQYLLELYDRFDNWPLAIAAYNFGPNAVAARLRNKQWDIGDGLDALPVPDVTKNYVIHIIGLAGLLEDGFLTFPEPIKTQPLLLNPPVDIHLLANLSGMEKEEIFHFNPSLNQAQYLNRSVTIHVPETLHEKIQNNISQAGPRFVYATVKKGDSMWSIARTHHTDVKSVKQLNQRSSVLKIGQKLKIPANQLAKASANINPLIPSNRRIRYRVRAGDSLWRIANRFGTTVKAIAKVNNLSRKSYIHAGDTLWVLAQVRPG
ncbi:membrane-bound lytic murein transglycosylase D [Mariprofundus aestuarium]|uniref:Membrane-bound lytic murein transglycosylase D n=1 Tax=Mariprofundus aestuarium TaxID=1921086 RepID=A0A2K8KY19_MARES|nr:LysM peptidoglycan-binding domain-containing protein [Mariprofundus aestuarium]ATX79865.1 membrane-bound lytic murein transglycosylase D [Mariprofundus aestuarium]